MFSGAQKAREVIFSVLRDACVDGDLTLHEAVEAAKDIFSENAVHFYKIKLPVKSFGSTNSISPIPAKIKTTAQSDVSLVRVLWVDASGQHRCRVSFSHFLFLFNQVLEVLFFHSQFSLRQF